MVVAQPGALERTVQLSLGDASGQEYVMQLTADLAVHAWDLARATGQDATLDPGAPASSATTRAGTRPPRARRNYAGTSPITRASGRRKILAVRFVRNDRLIGAPMIQAFAALRARSSSSTRWSPPWPRRGSSSNRCLRTWR